MLHANLIFCNYFKTKLGSFQEVLNFLFFLVFVFTFSSPSSGHFAIGQVGREKLQSSCSCFSPPRRFAGWSSSCSTAAGEEPAIKKRPYRGNCGSAPVSSTVAVRSALRCEGTKKVKIWVFWGRENTFGCEEICARGKRKAWVSVT